MSTAKYEVVESYVLVHKQTKHRISQFSVLPYGRNEDWELEPTGWTVFNPFTNQHGVGRVPWKTREEAQAYADKYRPSRIGIGD